MPSYARGWSTRNGALGDGARHEAPTLVRRQVQAIFLQEPTNWGDQLDAAICARADSWFVVGDLGSRFQVLLLRQQRDQGENLGEARIAYYIFEHGIPTMLNSPLLKGVLERSGVPLQIPLQYLLEELMRWYAKLLKWLAERKIKGAPRRGTNS